MGMSSSAGRGGGGGTYYVKRQATSGRQEWNNPADSCESDCDAHDHENAVESPTSKSNNAQKLSWQTCDGRILGVTKRDAFPRRQPVALSLFPTIVGEGRKLIRA